MKRKKRIETILSKKFSFWKVEVNDISILHKGHNNFDGNEETHFSIILNSNKQNRESKLEIHREINRFHFENPIKNIEKSIGFILKIYQNN